LFAINDSPNGCIDRDLVANTKVVELFSNASIPILMSLGCDLRRHHDYAEVETILGTGSKTFAGVLVYEFLEDPTVPVDWGMKDNI
jgi:hypothetical protein